MKRFVAGAVMAASLFAWTLPATAAPTLAPVLAPIVAAMKASNAGDRAGLIALFTPDATVVDNFAPYRFAPPDGVGKWYDGFGADAAASGSTGGASREIFRLASKNSWTLLATPYAMQEIERNLFHFPAAATADWNRLRGKLLLMDDVFTIDRPTVFAPAQRRVARRPFGQSPIPRPIFANRPCRPF